MRHAIAITGLLFLAACSREGSGVVTDKDVPAPIHVIPAVTEIEAPAGLYALEPATSKIAVSIQYVDNTIVTATFPVAEASLQLEPYDPERSSVIATIETRSVRTNIRGFDDLIGSPAFLDVERYPAISFLSTNVVRTGASEAELTGDLSLHGVTRPVTLKAKFVSADTMDAAHPRVRFTAETKLRRTNFNLFESLPIPGDQAGVADFVTVTIDGTFRRVNPTPDRVTSSVSGKKSPASPE